MEIDLRNKPTWYREVNPNEAVPALRQGTFVLRESLIINEYIDELAPDPALMPASPRERAMARLWIDFAGTRFVPLFYQLLKAQEEEERMVVQDRLLTVLGAIDAELKHRHQNGTRYWFGGEIGLTDIAFYPWFERWPVLEHYRGLAIPGELTSLLCWMESMKRSDSVKKAGMPADFYIAEYEDYASKGMQN